MVNVSSNGSPGSAVRAVLIVALGVGALAAAPRDARAELYKDEKKGFSLNTPKKWRQLPLAADEKWVVASFARDRPYRVDDVKTRTYTEHTPQIDVVILPKSDTERKGVTVERTDEGVRVSGNRAEYKDFKDYLEQTSQMYGGFFFSEEKETKVGNLKVTVYEVTIDKLTSSPRKRWGWAFHTDEAVYGITGDALVKWQDEVRPDLEAAFRSFKVIPHTQALGGVATGKTPEVTIVDGKKLTPEEGRKKRDEEFGAYLSRVKEMMQEGWKVKESEHYIAVTHCDDKFTKETLDHAEALRGWFDESLGFLGDHVPGRKIIRICADQNEYMSMWKSSGFAAINFEVYTYKDRSGSVDARLWALNDGLYRLWLWDKNPELRGRLPVWVSSGLSDCITTATSKGRKVEFKAASFDNERIATLRRADKLISARDFVTKGTPELSDIEGVKLQAEYFARYLLTGAAQKNPKYRNLLSDYLKNFVAMVKETAEETKDAEPEKPPESEEEENARFRERQNRWKELERGVLDKLLEMTFKGWTDKDWDSFNHSYWKELGV